PGGNEYKIRIQRLPSQVWRCLHYNRRPCYYCPLGANPAIKLGPHKSQLTDHTLDVWLKHEESHRVKARERTEIRRGRIPRPSKRRKCRIIPAKAVVAFRLSGSTSEPNPLRHVLRRMQKRYHPCPARGTVRPDGLTLARPNNHRL